MKTTIELLEQLLQKLRKGNQQKTTLIIVPVQLPQPKGKPKKTQ